MNDDEQLTSSGATGGASGGYGAHIECYGNAHSTSSGTYNTLIGHAAGYSITSGSHGVCIGYTPPNCRCIAFGADDLKNEVVVKQRHRPLLVRPGCPCEECVHDHMKKTAGDGCQCGTCFVCQYVLSHECYTEPGFNTCTLCSAPVPTDEQPKFSAFRHIGQDMYVHCPDKMVLGCIHRPEEQTIEFNFSDIRMHNMIHDSIWMEMKPEQFQHAKKFLEAKFMAKSLTPFEFGLPITGGPLG